MIAGFILLSIAFISMAAMDVIGHHPSECIFQKSKFSYFFLSDWGFKYKFEYIKRYDMELPVDAPDNWYYRFFNIEYKEKFPLSATLLVGFTNGWHFFKMIMILSIAGSIWAFTGHWWTMPTALVLYFVLFELFYGKIFVR